MTAQDLPAQLAELVTEFHEVPEPDKLQLLLEFLHLRCVLRG